MKDIKDITACVIDHGLFLPVAQRLSREYKRVLYWSPWEDAFPTMKKCIVGDGFGDVERIDNVWDNMHEADLFVFPDVGFAGMQKHLVDYGCRVWGHRGGDELEVNRGFFLDALKKVGLEVAKYAEVEGISELKAHLKVKTDKWIKVSKYRGDIETFHWRDWSHDESTLDFYAFKFGPAKELVKFYVFDPIDADIEDGYDGYCIDGKLPSTCIRGVEAKDRAYLGKVSEYGDISEELREVNDKFTPMLGKYGYRGFFSTEVRVDKKGKAYFIDPTLRCGSPPSQSMCELIGNLGEIVYAGAEGECADIVPTAEYAVQALLTLKRDKTSWGAVEIPKSLKQWTKFGFCCEIDGRTVFPPDGLDNDVGWLVSTGDTIAEAIENLKGRIKDLPDGLSCDSTALIDLLKEAKRINDAGMGFTDDEIPDPSVVIEES